MTEDLRSTTIMKVEQMLALEMLREIEERRIELEQSAFHANLEALRAAERLSEEDFAIRINAKD